MSKTKKSKDSSRRQTKASRPVSHANAVGHSVPLRRKADGFATVFLVALSFTIGMLSIKVFEKYETYRGKRKLAHVSAISTAELLPMKVKAQRAPVYEAPYRKAQTVGMYFKDFRLNVAGHGNDWVKIGPERYMYRSDLEGIEKKAF
ncbi:MAG: hypothetical protein H7249_09880 [Chitinophagaceae bacterium]|nr:hypothetical protein [Oligoflexus sp.]